MSDADRKLKFEITVDHVPCIKVGNWYWFAFGEIAEGIPCPC